MTAEEIARKAFEDMHENESSWEVYVRTMQAYALKMIKEDRGMIRDAVLKHWGEHIDIEDIDTIYLINPIGSQ